MRIDPKGTIAGYPALLVRHALRRLQGDLEWSVARLEAAASLPAGEGLAFAKALSEAGLAKADRPGAWEITQAGQTLTSATAARPVKRATADRALRDFLGRVEEVNRKRSYLGKVVAVVLFGSMLKPEVDLLNDVDVAVEIVPKEADAERARAKSERRARDLERLGYHFRGFLDRQVCWHREVFQHLKGRSRVISLADLRQEGEFILAVPHRILYSERGWKPYVPPPTVALLSSSPKPDDCPF